MSDVFDIFIYLFGKLTSFLFGSYLFPGVSIGMLFVVGFVFGILLRNLIIIPESGNAIRRVDGAKKKSNRSNRSS